MLAGMETPTSGRILLDGQDVTWLPPYERPINMMFQSYALFPHMTVEQNIAFGLRQDKLSKADINERVARMLELVQMSKYARRKPFQLSASSSAWRWRAAWPSAPSSCCWTSRWARWTKTAPANPAGAGEHDRARGVTCIMVTHDQEEAMTMASRVGIMSEGQLLQVASPSEIYERPNCRFTAEFIGETNLFSGQGGGGRSRPCADRQRRAAPADLCRPRHHRHAGHAGVGVAAPRAGGPVAQRAGRRLQPRPGHGARYRLSGRVSIYHIQLASGKSSSGQRAATRWRDEPAPTWGESVHLSWADNDAVVLTL